MKSTEKLIQRLKNELALDIPDGTVIKTLHTGRHQKAAGRVELVVVSHQSI